MDAARLRAQSIAAWGDLCCNTRGSRSLVERAFDYDGLDASQSPIRRLRSRSIVSNHGDRANLFVPSHVRPMSPGEQWIVDRAAESFLTTGLWPKRDKLIRDAHRAGVELPEIVIGMPVQDFIWRPDTQETIVLSIPGLWRSSSGGDFVRQFLRVVLLCRDIYLGEDDEPPKITSGAIRVNLGLDEDTIARVCAELPFEYFITAGGGAKSDTEWFYFISETVARFRNVSTIEQYFEERAKIIAPRWPHAWSSPVTAKAVSPPTWATTEPSGEGQPLIDPRDVFVVHGRDLRARDAMFGFLEALGLHPLDWNEMVRRTGKGTPHTLRVIDVGFNMAKAFVVVMTPDDEARLHSDLQEPNDSDDERNLTCQPRPNVMFEAGRAFGKEPDRTILVQIGKLRRVSDLEGLNVVRIGRTKAPLQALADRLDTAGCPIDRSAVDLFDPSRFANLPSHDRAPKGDHQQQIGPRVGRVLSSDPRPARLPRLTAKLLDRGNRNWLLEIANRGSAAARNVEWELTSEAPNWFIERSGLPEYPIRRLDPQKYVRLPAAIAMGGPVYVELLVRALTEAGEPYETTEQLSVYG